MRGYKIHPATYDSNKSTAISSQGVDHLRDHATFTNNTTTDDILEQQHNRCGICCESAQMFNFYKCGHKFCLNCLCKYVQEKMNQNDRILCCYAGCTAQLQALSIKQGSTLMFMDHLDQQSINQILTYLQNYKQLGKKCQKCATNSKQKECQECRQKKLMILPEGHKFCPNCRNIIEKAKGCDHVKCICTYQFCFFCESKWSNNHICEYKIPHRTGPAFILCLIAKIPLYTILVVSLAPIYFSLGLLFCLLTAFIFGFFMQFKLLEMISRHQDMNQCLKFILFLLVIVLTPVEVTFGAIPGLFVPIYNIFSNNKIMYSTDVLMQLIDGFVGCIGLLSLI